MIVVQAWHFASVDANAAGGGVKSGPPPRSSPSTASRGTRVQEIVQAAGVNERMVCHFGSKDGLYRAVIRDQRRDLGMAWQPVLATALGMDTGRDLRTGPRRDRVIALPHDRVAG
jgi:hypothetical protein